MKFCFQLALAIVLVSTAFSYHHKNPLKDPNICGRPTCKGTGKFKYGPGTQQNYQYSVDVRSLFNGTSKNESSLFVEATVTLDFLTPCDGLLTLSEVTLSETRILNDETVEQADPLTPEQKNSELFAEAISEYSLRFAFNDGIIYELCPEEEEKNWVLNFKRGLLSMIHNTMKRFDLDHTTVEEDVRGKCNAEYKVLRAKETSLIIEKNKDLSSCEGRSKLHSMVQSTPYNFRTKFNEGESLLKSKSRCEMSIDHHIYNEITCEESHVLAPFSNQDAGASTIVRQRLILVEELKSAPEEGSEITRRTSLLFNHVPTPKPKHSELKTSRDLIKKMCKLSTDDVQIEFSELFTKFIHTLRLLSYPALKALYDHASRTCPTGKKHLLDALPYVGSASSVTLMKNIILKGIISETTTNEWMMAVAFTARPDDEMMEPAAELLRENEFSRSIALSIAALTHTYCTQNINCQSNDAVEDIIRTLETRTLEYYNLGDRRQRKERDILMVSMKALANIGVVSNEFKMELRKMIEDTELDVSLRVAAVESHRRLPCEESRSFFERIFRDQDEDAELRIASYLQIMRCPNYVMIRTVRHCLEVEEVNQVGSFVWSHLNNLLKSAIPSRVEVQGLLSDQDLVKKFSSDIRKFSHNREGSIFFEDYNIGANYENNVIFSPSSYIPKSAMLNLTVDLFGESVNILEVYGRAEGFEKYLESIFGPKGPLSSKYLQDKIPKMRWARSNSEADKLKNEVEELPNVMDNKFGHPRVALGLKVFGNELKYATFEGDDEIKAAVHTLNPLDHLKRILSGNEINYDKAAMFLDSSYVVSSGAGFPISLNAVGTASVNLRLFGSLNAARFAQTKELDLRADIRPSISLNVIGTMSVDAFYASTAIKLRTSMYTSSAIDGHLKIRGPRLVSLKFSIPRQTSEIFGARSELIVIRNNVEEKQGGLQEASLGQSICSWPAVDKTVGLKLCADYHFINVTKINDAPYFILAGPAGFKLSLQKSDPTANVYLFEYKYHDGKDSSFISLTFDTPGSTLRRLLSANLTVDRQSQNLTLLLQSSAGTVLAKGRYKNTVEEKYLQLGLDINDKKHFDTSLSLLREESLHGYTYYPKAYLGVNGERVLELQGTVKLVSKNGISQYDVDMKFQTKRLTSKLFGYVSLNDASIAVNMKLDYKFAFTKEQRVMFEFSLANRSPRNLVVIRGTCSLSSTAYPNFNFDAKLKFQRGTGHTECKFELTSLPVQPDHPEADKLKLKFQWLLSLKAYPDSRRVLNTIMSVNRLSTGLSLHGQLSYQTSGPDINIVALVRYAEGKEVSATIFWSHPRTTLEHMEGKINITVPGFTPMVLEGKLHENIASDYSIDVSATWFSGHSISIKGVYQDRSTARTSNHHLKLIFESPSFSDINANLQFYHDNDELKIDLKAHQDKYEYGILIKHITPSEEQVTVVAKLRYRTKMYSLIYTDFDGDHRKIDVELHLDQIRDLHFGVYAYNNAEKFRAYGFDVKWDANRDPNQKLTVSTNFTKIQSFNYEGNLLVSYPGRTILGDLEFLLMKGKIKTLTRLSWSENHTLAFTLDSTYRNEYDTKFTLRAELFTPFDEWKKTSLTTLYQHDKNMYHVNGSMFWQYDHRVSVDLFEDYTESDKALDFEVRGTLDSTLENIPSLSASVKHGQNETTYQTNLHLMHDPESIIDINSKWNVDRDDKTLNISGIVISTTPFKGYKKGHIISKIYITRTKNIQGIADMDFDHRKTSISVKGHMRKITDSMLEVNVTTPVEKYKRVTGRFGISDERKHLVAEIIYPAGQLGVEVLLSLHSITDFDAKFSLATPLEALQRILIVGKLKPETADFRLGFNSMLAGFTGVWHYVNDMDFEYSYKIYTPIEGLEENGVVAKLIFKEGLDFEVGIKLSQYKLGAKIQASPQPATLYEYDQSGEIYLYRWTGLLELDLIIYPTLKGTIELEQQDPKFYLTIAKITLPHGQLELINEFERINEMAMKNELHLTTPYLSVKEVTSDFTLMIVPGSEYLLGLTLDYLNDTRWIKTEGRIECTMSSPVVGGESYYLKLHLNTPFEKFPRLDVLAGLGKEPNIYRSNLSVTTNSSDISMAATAEITKTLFNTSINGHVKIPLISTPEIYLRLRREIVDGSKNIEVHYIVPETMKEELQIKALWKYESIKNLDTYIELHSPFTGFEEFIAGMKISTTESAVKTWTKLHMAPILIDSNSTLTPQDFKSASDLVFRGNRYPVIINCLIQQKGLSRTEFPGTLYIRDKEYKITGGVDYEDNIPAKGHFIIIPVEGGENLVLDYKLVIIDSRRRFFGEVRFAERYCKVDAQATVMNQLDWDVQVQVDSSHPIYNRFLINVKTASIEKGIKLTIDARTPFPKLQNPKFEGTYESEGLQKQIQVRADVADTINSVDAKWRWVFLEFMDIDLSSRFENYQINRQTRIIAFYTNPERDFHELSLGGQASFGDNWTAGSNLTFYMPSTQNITVSANAMLPPPYQEFHSGLGHLYYKEGMEFIEYIANYKTANTKKEYGSSGSYTATKRNHAKINVDVDWNHDKYSNEIDLKSFRDKIVGEYRLWSPKYKNEETFISKMSYGTSRGYTNITFYAFLPKSSPLASIAIDFKEFRNMNGTLNVTLPFEHIKYIGVDFDAKTTPFVHNRFIKVFWPDRTALLDSKCTIETGKSVLERDTNGVLSIEIPLATRHIAHINYNYKERGELNTGEATVDYNDKKLLEGKYNCLSQSRAGFDKSTIHVELENQFVPIGADYVYEYQYIGPWEGSNAQTVKKNIHLFHLKNRTKFDVYGDMNISTKPNGQEIALSATHSSRTVKLWTKYDLLDQQLKQQSRLELSPTVWIAYDLDLLNKTVDEMFDAQQMQIVLSYPRRSFTGKGFYNISETSVSTDVSLMWNENKKIVQAGLDWNRQSPSREQVQLQIKHPSFEKDVVVLGEYEHDSKKLIDVRLTVDYSTDPEQTFKLGSKVEDNCQSNMYNYTYNLWASHPATNLNLNTHGGFYWNPYGYNTVHYTDYRRSYLPLQQAEASAHLDLLNNVIEIKKKETLGLVYLYAHYEGQFPIYIANLSTSHKENDGHGEFYINFKEKLIKLDHNMTTDGSQSLHMYGKIPDARSAIFDMWRDYDDIRISDVAYYLKLNHSRLIVSRLYWRPDLIPDIQNSIRSSIKEYYDEIVESVNVSRQYIRSEINEAIHGVWQDAKPHLHDFLEDLRELKVIESDLEDLKIFLNNSYNANAFYMKDIYNTIVYLCDELALKTQLEQLPAIVKEIWEIMGESGKKIQRSIAWIIEKIKIYYQNASEFLKGLFEGDPVEYLTEALKHLIEQYDEFIKNTHVAFVQYMEQLWQQAYAVVIDNWHKTLAAIEPTVLKLVHYLETILWNTGREVLDFLYAKKSEIMESEYFLKFTKFTHDVDVFYRDITGNNTISSIIKYSKAGWEFVSHKILTLVPFAKELKEVINEIIEEISQLKNLPSVRYILDRLDELYKKAKWFYEYFNIESRLQRLIILIHKKLTDMSQTALEAENRYRHAKTKFYFEPSEGVMYLEQKLPMSWHAFNETPKFQEIPELRTLYKIKNYFDVSQASFWNFYHDYKPYTDPSDWLPPFKAQALIAGPRYYVTFDRRYYEFRGTCQYLLATDFLDKNFTIVVSYDDSARTHELMVLVKNTVVHINVFKDMVKVGDGQIQHLPMAIDNTYIYREADIVTINSDGGFTLECNMKFDICIFEVSGWYFGKTAGLWGTVNNEPSDDLLTSDKRRAKLSEVSRFANSWAMNKDCVESTDSHKESSPSNYNPPENIVSLCEDIFQSKVSQLSTCFSRVDKEPFMAMCLNSTTEEEACTSAVAYINLCAYANTPLRIPDSCIKCNLANGRVVSEGTFVQLRDEDVPRSSDIVFIVEAKECNSNIKNRKHLDFIAEYINKELSEKNITNNRFAVVVFGGDGVLDEPRNVVIDSKAFTDHMHISPYFDYIYPGNGSVDIFGAITFTTKLLYRPGVTKNFILLPCSECKESNMKLDYAILHQLLFETDVTLHILMNGELSVAKAKDNRPFGIDRFKAYTKKDIRVLTGDTALRKQVSLPKSTLGFCSSLALETNGSVFSVNYLEQEKRNALKKFAIVFAKRVAESAVPRSCVDCECTAPNTGVSYMECFPCIYPTRANIDYKFDENEALSVLQPSDDYTGEFFE